METTKTDAKRAQAERRLALLKERAALMDRAKAAFTLDVLVHPLDRKPAAP